METKGRHEGVCASPAPSHFFLTSSMHGAVLNPANAWVFLATTGPRAVFTDALLSPIPFQTVFPPNHRRVPSNRQRDSGPQGPDTNPKEGNAARVAPGVKPKVFTNSPSWVRRCVFGVGNPLNLGHGFPPGLVGNGVRCPRTIGDLGLSVLGVSMDWRIHLQVWVEETPIGLRWWADQKGSVDVLTCLQEAAIHFLAKGH